MLAHKVDGENPVTYSEMLLAAQKLERWAEARDPLLLKTTTTGGLNLTCSHSQSNLFLSRKLKGSLTFKAQSAAVEDHETEEDLGSKPDGEKEAESSVEEDMGMSGKVGGTDQLLGYIIWFTNAVELTRKEPQLLWVWQPRSPGETLPKGPRKTAREVGLNLREGMVKKGGWTSLKLVTAQQATPDEAPWA